MTNALSGLGNAQQNNWPMLLLGGANGIDQNGMGAFQEERQVEPPRRSPSTPLGRSAPSRIPYYIEQAVRTASYGRPGAAYLDLPDDVILGRVDEDDREAAGDRSRSRRAAGRPTPTSPPRSPRCRAPSARW